jgi:hypothetical protein
MLALGKFDLKYDGLVLHLINKYDFNVFERIPELLETVKKSFKGKYGLNYLE